MGDFKHLKCPWKTGMFSLNIFEFGCWKGVEILQGIFMWNSRFSSGGLPAWYGCFVFQKKLFDKPTSIKKRIYGLSEHYESLGCLEILSFTFQPQWLFECVFSEPVLEFEGRVRHVQNGYLTLTYFSQTKENLKY